TDAEQAKAKAEQRHQRERRKQEQKRMIETRSVSASLSVSAAPYPAVKTAPAIRPQPYHCRPAAHHRRSSPPAFPRTAVPTPARANHGPLSAISPVIVVP